MGSRRTPEQHNRFLGKYCRDKTNQSNHKATTWDGHAYYSLKTPQTDADILVRLCITEEPYQLTPQISTLLPLQCCFQQNWKVTALWNPLKLLESTCLSPARRATYPINSSRKESVWPY